MPGAAGGAGKLLKEAKTPEEAARAATVYERAEGYNAATHIDNWTAKTLKGIGEVSKDLHAPADKAIIPGQGDPHKPGFDFRAVPFHDFHSRLQSAPLGSDKHSMNEIHDHRAVTNDVNIHVSGGFPVEKTARPLDRPKNADLIRNTASYTA